MMHKAKKAKATALQFTSHTLWTAPCEVRGEKWKVKITKEMQEQFKQTLAASETALKAKLETFEPVDMPEAATRTLVR